ncbi:MAG: hypothetical protein WCO60_13615 [Verrucomicrobiota bacterium]
MSRQVDGATPQPVQKMTYDELLLFVVEQQKLTNKVVTLTRNADSPLPPMRMQKGISIRRVPRKF